MKRVLVILLVVLGILATLVFVGAMFLAPLLRYEERVDIEAPAILAIDLQGRVVERAPPEFFAAQLEGAEHDLFELRMAIDRASRDDRVAGIHLRVGNPGYGWAKAEELRANLAAFRDEGKFVYAFTPATNELGYYVAVVADSVFLLPHSGLEMNGFRVETPFVQELFEKIGIQPQVEAVGVYKSAADMFRRTNMSDPDREATRAILDGIYGRFLDAVVEGRGVDRARFARALDAGVYLGRDLQALGLVDGELHESEVLWREVARALGEDPRSIEPDDVEGRVVDIRDYASERRGLRRGDAGTIGLVYAIGPITSGDSGFDPLFGRTMGASTMKRLLREVAEDEALDAVVIRVDTPGGDAIASEEIWGAVETLNRNLPVIVSMGDVAASGGYYMAAGADRIVAYPSTLTGSIGVFGILFDASGTYDRFGIDWETLETNPAADFPTTTRPLTEDERKTFRSLIEHAYRSFLGRVAEGRGMSVAKADSVAQGRVWSGAAAAERGLVDEVGGLDTALAAAKTAAGIDPGARVALHVYPRQQTFMDRIREAFALRAFRDASSGPSTDARARGIAFVAQEMGRGLAGFAVALRQAPGRPIAALPWIPEIR